MKDRIEVNKSKCCGCSACISVCPKHAIEMQPDENGFLYPKIQEKLCIKCGLCKVVCPYYHAEEFKSQKDTFVASAADMNLIESASGGVFASIALQMIQAGGVVYGCALADEHGKLTPKHIRTENELQLIRLKGSKYVQSEIGSCYLDVKRDLKENRLVLFSGTPCQIAGLRGFLQRDYSNLFTIDIICHGVPSVQMFHDYLAFEEKRHKKKIEDFKFREKSEGWKLHGKMVLVDDKGRKEIVTFEPEQSSYYQLFLNSYTYRENCYYCPYACDNRPGDITIGDYWCIDLVHPEVLLQNGGYFDETKGVSCLIINNEHGRKMLQQHGSGLMTVPSTFENAAKYNGQLVRPSRLKPERKIAMEKYARGYAYLDRWYRRKQLPIILMRNIRTAIPRNVKDLLKKMI